MTQPAGKVLVIDDEELVRATLQRLLSPPHALTNAASAQQALGLIEAGQRFDVILCDLMMPGMSGIDLHHALAKTCSDQARRMVFMTGGNFTSSGSDFLDTVANARLAKPFLPVEVRELVLQQLALLGNSGAAND
ncbi:MAG: response regulator [Polyangiaceae bacterium]